VVALILLADPLQAQSAAADHAAHGHDPAETGALTLDDGKRWETDEPLRRGMTEIRVASDMLSAAYAARQLSAAQSQQLGEAVRGSVATMIAQCQLVPAADAVLHVILGDILTAVSALEADPLSARGIPGITAALDEYGHYFEHPGWLAGSADDEHAHHH